MLFRYLLLAFLCISTLSYAQRKKKTSKNSSQVTSVGPYYPDANKYMPKKKKVKSKDGISRQAQENAMVQREVVAKQKRKAEKVLAGTDYANTNYFGHKRPPKKRKPEKMKFCEICGIRH